jgi:malate synthase
VAHPDLVAVVDEVFRAVLAGRPNQKDRQREDAQIRAEELLDVRIPGGRVTEAGVRSNMSVALQYLAAWLGGSGAVAINNLMEDAATAEIARSQLWQWIRHNAKTEDGKPVTRERCLTILAEESSKLVSAGTDDGRLATAATLLADLFSAEEFPEFLTLAAYERL